MHLARINLVRINKSYLPELMPALRSCITLLLLSLTLSCGTFPNIYEVDLKFSVSNGAATNKNYINTGDIATLSWTAPTTRLGLNQHLISLTVAGQNQAINTAVATQAGTLQVSPTITTIYNMTAVYQYNSSTDTVTSTLPVTLFVDEPTIADLVPDASLQSCFSVTYANQFNETLLDCRSKLPPIADVTGLNHFTTLTTLLLTDNSLTDITPIASLTNLQILRIGDNAISSLSPLASLTKLESLSLTNNSGIMNVSVLPTLHNLVYVDATGLNTINCPILRALVKPELVVDAPQC